MKSRAELLEERKQHLIMQEEMEKMSNKGLKGVGKDIWKGAKNVYPALAEMFSNLPGETIGAYRQSKKDPLRLYKNIIGGGMQGLHGLASTPGNIRDYLVEKELSPSDSPSFRLPEEYFPKEFNANEAVGIEGHQRGDALLQGLASSAPYIAGGELGALGGLARTGARAGSQAAYGAGLNQNPVTAALMVPGMELPLRGAGAALNAARPRHSLRGNLPPAQIEANARAAEGTNTDLGSIVGSPILKQVFENMSTKWPGGGGENILANQAAQVEERAENLLNESGANLPPGERNAQLKTALETAYETQRQRKNELYEPVNQIAEEEGFSLVLPTFRNRVQQQMRSILRSPLLQHDADFRAALGKLAGLEDPEIAVESAILGQNGLPIISEIIRPSILETNMTAGKLHEEGTRLKNNKNASAHDRAIGNLYLDLANRARNDIRAELEARGSPELQEAYETATENYRENFSQFLDQDIYRLAQPEVEAETIINDIIKPGAQKDKFLRIEKIQNALPPEQRNILGNAWLRNAIDKEGSLNPKQFSQMINKLGPRQFEALFPDPNYRQQLLDYGRLRGMNEKALSRLANPSTGQQLAVPAMIMGQVSAVANNLSNGNYLQALGWALGPQVGSRLANRLLTDPNYRNMVLEGLQQPPRPNPMQNQNSMAALLSGQAQQYEGDE